MDHGEIGRRWALWVRFGCTIGEAERRNGAPAESGENSRQAHQGKWNMNRNDGLNWRNDQDAWSGGIHLLLWQ